MKSLLLEAGLLLVIGAAIALAANHFSPRGLNLSRDYFPKTANPVNPSPAVVPTTLTNVATPDYGAPAVVVERLRQKGLQPIAHDQVLRLFRDPQYAQGAIIFVDARDDDHYQAGHIPAAYQFDNYHIEKYLPSVLPVCLAAKQVVVYCNGGECEDSEFGTITLSQAGVPMSRLVVYTGGIAQWSSNALPVETGDRNSGQFKPARQ